MTPDVQVRDLAEEEYDLWDDLVRGSPEGSPYAVPGYLEALCEATGGSFSIRAAFRGDELVGGIGLYVERRPQGRVVSPRLLLYYNGPVLRHYDTRYPSDRTRRHLHALRALESSLRTDGFAKVALKPRNPLLDVRVFLHRGWSATPVHSYEVSLRDLEGLRGRMDRNARRLVNRAEREGLVLSRDVDFDTFYRFHRETHERKGAPLYLPERRFARFFERLAGRGLAALYHARMPDGRSVASQLVLLGPHPMTHTVCAGADDSAQSLGANPFLRWKVFEDLNRLGYDGNDLTDASLNPVTDFKAQLGGELVVSFEMEREGAASRRKRSRPVRRLGARVQAGLRHLGFLS